MAYLPVQSLREVVNPNPSSAGEAVAFHLLSHRPYNGTTIRSGVCDLILLVSDSEMGY